MNEINIRVKKLNEQAVLPSFGSVEAAGADLRACTTELIEIPPAETVMIPTGLALQIPAGYAGLIYARSGMASKRGLAPANKVGVIDSDYRGEVMVALHNHGNQPAQVEPGERIAQLVITVVPPTSYLEVDTLDDTDRGEGGFGSTGTK